jgi:hypothetical protein
VNGQWCSSHWEERLKYCWEILHLLLLLLQNPATFQKVSPELPKRSEPLATCKGPGTWVRKNLPCFKHSYLGVVCYCSKTQPILTSTLNSSYILIDLLVVMKVFLSGITSYRRKKVLKQVYKSVEPDTTSLWLHPASPTFKQNLW